MCKRLLPYLSKEHILYKFQFGFRKNRSTILAIIEIVENIRSELDKGNSVSGSIPGPQQGDWHWKPWSSVFGPILFLLYVNDMYKCIGEEGLRIFADDTNTWNTEGQIEKSVKYFKRSVKAHYLLKQLLKEID